MIQNHRFTNARFVASDNYNHRPSSEISLVVIHNISLPPNEFGGSYIEQFFTNSLNTDLHPFFSKIKDLKVSAHLLIKRDGSIVQFVPFDKRAWHAGESNFKGRQNCNDFSIGIELEGADNLAYEKKQYEALNKAIKAIKLHYPITDVVGHSDIAPGRKTDPGSSFDWDQLED